MNYVLIILGVILLVALYFLYVLLLGQNTVVASKVYLKGGIPSQVASNLTKYSSANFNYSLWIYVNTVPIEANGTKIFSAQGFTLKIDSKMNLLLATDLFPTSNPIIISNNFPLQRWEYVIISVSSSLLDIYLDGKLLKSLQLSAAPPVLRATDQISFGDMDAFLAAFQRNPVVMDPQTAWNNYVSGNANNFKLSNYGASMTLSKDNVTQHQFVLF
jgi:hypothetical protein